jgi:hypothetical protein
MIPSKNNNEFKIIGILIIIGILLNIFVLSFFNKFIINLKIKNMHDIDIIKTIIKVIIKRQVEEI